MIQGSRASKLDTKVNFIIFIYKVKSVKYFNDLDSRINFLIGVSTISLLNI